ncbi:hypothetical protein BOTBODRAFT_586377 [Botryobasidium botryosum FD-172 SS1]|uniref:Uncharacterized protein n=1 Tax=Botryobasidium botryosum (strain FD-172 SS1) TaxID=930990 RepID=A0A067M061_BOTB1|nr:hypothetical protein BOTBODRAFT_586377 [Botryobasidium botryosum FD-172 SS1]
MASSSPERWFVVPASPTPPRWSHAQEDFHKKLFKLPPSLSLDLGGRSNRASFAASVFSSLPFADAPSGPLPRPFSTLEYRREEYLLTPPSTASSSATRVGIGNGAAPDGYKLITSLPTPPASPPPADVKSPPDLVLALNPKAKLTRRARIKRCVSPRASKILPSSIPSVVTTPSPDSPASTSSMRLPERPRLNTLRSSSLPIPFPRRQPSESDPFLDVSRPASPSSIWSDHTATPTIGGRSRQGSTVDNVGDWDEIDALLERTRAEKEQAQLQAVSALLVARSQVAIPGAAGRHGL